ncbi:hypothetical protein [Geobacillus thermoleovorans]|nr:hypothetical protein [Geobacillus thermoleovorans]
MSQQNKTIVLYNGQSQYGVLRYFIQDPHTWLARAEKIVETVMYHKHFMA